MKYKSNLKCNYFALIFLSQNFVVQIIFQIQDIRRIREVHHVGGKRQSCSQSATFCIFFREI